MDNKIMPSKTRLFFYLSILGLVISIVPIHTTVMYIGLGISSIALVGGIITKTQEEQIQKELSVVFSLVAIASLIVWIIFFMNILDTLV